MDDESKQMLREMLDLQREQTELLRKYLLPPWMRTQFSVRSLLILMTLVAFVLAGLAMMKQRQYAQPATQPATQVFVK